MTLRPCRCGQLPAITEKTVSQIHILRLECACGEHGATLMYTKPEDRDKMRQAGIDGWNLADV